MSPVQIYFENLEKRIHNDGWVEIILPIVVPIITEWLQRCLDNGTQLRQAIERPTWLQRQATNGMARRIVIDSNIPRFRRRLAIPAVAAAIQAAAKDTAKMDMGIEAWNDIFNELITL